MDSAGDGMYILTMPTPTRPTDRPSRVNNAVFNATTESALSCGYFAAGPGYRTTRPHGRSDWLMLVTADGGGRFRHGEATAIAPRRSVAIYLADQPQDYGTDAQAGSWTFAFSHVTPRPSWARLVASWPEPVIGLAMVSIADDAIWQQTWAAMTRARQLLAAPHRGREMLTTNALEAMLLWADEANPTRGPALDPRVRKAAELARVHIDELLTADQLAKAAGLSVSRLTVLFREQLGESPVSYAERLRLEHAATLIAAGGLSVKEAAAACGYDDPFHFSRRFAHRMGKPPSHFR